MSREHMLYDNKPLRNIPVSTHTWDGAWDQEKRCMSGPGAIIEGKVLKRSRHVISFGGDSSSKRERYLVMHLSISRAHRRRFDANGAEVEPNFSVMQKVATGHLNSSYRVQAKGQTDVLSETELRQMVLPPGDSTTSKILFITKQLTPSDTIPFWISEDAVADMEIVDGDSVRLKTRGNSNFISSIVQIGGGEAAQKANYTGVAGQTNWTDKILAMKRKDDDAGGDHDPGEHADDSEWD